MSQALGLALFCLALVLVTRGLGRPARAIAIVLGLAMPMALAVPVLRESKEPRDLSVVPYEASDACVRCHPDHHDSWHRSYHRTMTQEATAEAVKGDFSDVRVVFYGVESRMYRAGDAFFIDTVDPEWASRVRAEGFDLRDLPNPRRVTWKIELAIGSHNFQQYAIRLANGAYIRLPVAWHFAENRWVHMNGAFLQPEDDDFHGMSTLWNTNCIFCHNVKARPRAGIAPGDPTDVPSLARLSYTSEVAEFGVACEACHGPGEAHTRAHANATRRYLYAGKPDPTIVNPARLDKERSAQVCGHCHSFHIPVQGIALERLRNEDPYTAGEDLMAYVKMQTAESFVDGIGEQTRISNFWGDGTIKRTSIEFLGLVSSPCYERGEMTCLSCHSAHTDDPVDQLAPGMRGNAACTACHPAYQEEAALTAHTQHDADSSGSLCYNCHMPNVVWGLLRGMRTHRIITPRIATAVETGMPHACNQCHLDRTLAWTQEAVERWYGEEPVALGGDDDTTVASLVQLLRGDAAQRAIAAWTFGWDDARAASHAAAWAPRYLLLTMEDSYPAVRQAAFRSLRAYAAIATAEFDYLAEPAVRTLQIAALRTRLRLPRPLASDLEAEAGPLRAQLVRGELQPAHGIPDDGQTLDLLARQERRRIHISE